MVIGVGYSFVASRKGKRQLLVDGHLFGCKEQRGERTYWTCTEYYKSGCPGRCVTFRGALKVTGGQHNHAAQWPLQALPALQLQGPPTFTTASISAVVAPNGGPSSGAAGPDASEAAATLKAESV